MAGSILDLITTPSLVTKAREDLNRRLRGKVYIKDPSAEPPIEKARELAKTYKGKS
jgi:hypothetical protein